MSYATRKINKFNLLVSICFSILVTIAYAFGHFFYSQKVSVLFFTIIMLSSLGYYIIEKIRKYHKNIENYEKGKKGEDWIEEILKKIPSINYKRGAKTSNGDLDFLVNNDEGKYFGLAVKNYGGRVTYDNIQGKLLINGNATEILNKVKSACAELQGDLSEKNVQLKFVQPVVVFCDNRACVDIPGNVIRSGNIEVNIIGSSQLANFLKMI